MNLVNFRLPTLSRLQALVVWATVVLITLEVAYPPTTLFQWNNQTEQWTRARRVGRETATLKREWIEARTEDRDFVNPIEPRILRWMS